MKSRNKKRLLALVLCMVVAISNSSFIFASETGQTEYPQEAEVQTQDEAVADDMDVAAYAADEGQAVAEEQPAAVEQVAAEPETTVENQVAQPVAEAPAAEQPTTEAPAAETPAAQASVAQEPAAVSEGATTSENTNAAVGEAQTPQGEENGETVTYNQKMDLKQDFTDELENVVATVSAEIPKGAFQVGESSQITMEVNTLTDTEKTQLENLMKEKIPAEKELGQYVAYNIRFKVDGTETESLQPIKITMTGDKTQIDDVENATVFYLDPADPTVPGDKDELEEVIQRTALIKSLQEAGQSIENIDEAYDLSDITLGTDGAAEKIQLEGRTSAIYGCYVENTPKEDVTDDGVSDEEPAGDETVSDEILNPATLAADTTGNTVTLNEDNGKLTASYTGGTDNYGFVWYRSINGGEYTPQEPTEYTSNTGKKLGYDIKTDASELYIALNGGALGYKNNGQENTNVKYQVKVFQKSDIGNNGLPAAEATAVATSREYVVTSYYEVRNGGFETPSMENYSDSYQQYTNDAYKEQNGVWQSTGVGKNGTSIEIVNTRKNFQSSYAWNGTDGAAEGEQFAELNCEEEGALYQDVLTTPGETLNYKFAHRARGLNQNTNPENDSMYVLIMSTKLAQNITTHRQVRNVINNLAAYPGATVTKYTSNDQKWSRYAGTYNVPEGSDQYSTRFFFVSGNSREVASRDNKVGNFLDDIALTREKLTSVEGTATVTLEKAIIGLKYTEACDLAEKLSFQVGGRDISGTDLTWQWSGAADSYGTYTGSIVISIPEDHFGNLTLQENATTGNSLDVTGYDRNTSLFIDGNNTGSSESGTVTIGNRDSKTVSFKNVYSVQSSGGGGQEDEKTLSHEKYIKRNSDGTYDITLNASGTVGTHTDKALVDIVLVVDTSTSMKGDNIKDSKAAIKKMVEGFNAKDTVDVRYKLVTFGKKATIVTPSWVDGNNVYTEVKNISIKEDQATNYDMGFQKTTEALSTGARSGAKKIVVFLTDGEPTRYGEDAKGLGNRTSNNTLKAAYNSAKSIICDQFYAVGISLGTVPIYYENGRYKESTTGLTILQNIKNKTNNERGAVGAAWDLGESKELSGQFESIVGEITTLACEKVEISDTLSEYVKVTDNSKLRVKIAQKNSNGSFTSKYDQEFTLNGGNVSLNGKQIATANYNEAEKTATLTFVPTYQLEKDYYYYITITNVTPTEKAFDEYQTGTSYNATGASPSDASENGYYATTGGTSSDHKGFKSNATATVSYTYNNTPHTETYKDPVIQVETIAVEKQWVGIDTDDIKNQVVLVQLIDKDRKAVSGKILKLTNNNNFKGSFAVEETDNYGGVRELKQDNQGTITYEGEKYSMVDPEGTTTINSNSYKVTYSKYEKGKQTITNTRNSEKIKILKTGTNTALKLPGAEFTLKDSEGNRIQLGNNTTGTYTSDDNGLVIEGELNTGIYKLEEIKSPDGYVVLPGEITIIVSSEGDNKVTASGPSRMVSVKKSDEGVYEITVKNEVLYNLPSTGHSGIFNILMSGILLMFAGILIIYKMKGKEVLKK